MQWILFILQKISKSKNGSHVLLIMRLCQVTIILCVTILILSLSMIRGFQNSISDKIFDFSGHLSITDVDNGLINLDSSQLLQQYLQNNNIFFQKVIFNSVLLKSNMHMEGVIAKGIFSDFNTQFCDNYVANIQANRINDNDIWISKITAERLSLSIGQELHLYLIQGIPRIRKLTIAAIYNTGLTEYDQNYAYVSGKLLQKLNDVDSNKITGFEVFSEKYISIEDEVQEQFGQHYTVMSTMEQNPNIFEWLNLQNVNKKIIIILLLIVAYVSVISMLFVLILDRINMIGILQALGAKTLDVLKIFLLQGLKIISSSLLIGNILAVSICLIQNKFRVLTLPEESYYLSYVPISLAVSDIIYINAATILLSTIILFLVSFLIAKFKTIQIVSFS